MPVDDEVYPLADTGGLPLPFNIARPVSCIISPITDAVSAAFLLADIALPHVFSSDVDCFVGFNVIPSRISIVDQPSVLFVPAGKEVSVMPLHATLKVISRQAAAVGTLVVQAFGRYKASGRNVLQAQF